MFDFWGFFNGGDSNFRHAKTIIEREAETIDNAGGFGGEEAATGNAVADMLTECFLLENPQDNFVSACPRLFFGDFVGLVSNKLSKQISLSRL